MKLKYWGNCVALANQNRAVRLIGRLRLQENNEIQYVYKFLTPKQPKTSNM